MAERSKEELSGKAGVKELGPGAFTFKCPECDFETALPGYDKKEGPSVVCPKCHNPQKAMDEDGDPNKPI
jgi:hypothetical protein